MSSPSTHPTDAAEMPAIVQKYFAALADGRFDRVPWAETVILRTSLRPDATLRGRLEVEDFFRPMVGQLGPIRPVETYINTAGNAAVVEALIGPLHVMDKFLLEGGKIIEQDNIFDPRPVMDAPSPGGISRQERELLMDMLAASRDRVRSTIRTGSREAWDRKPDSGGWSAAECAEHLVLSEEALLQVVRRDILTSPANSAFALELTGKDATIMRAMENRASKQSTSDFLQPAKRWSDQGSVLDAFLARRADTLDYCRTTRDALHYHASPLGSLGLLDGFQWLLVLAAHTDRHIAQMQEALAA